MSFEQFNFTAKIAYAIKLAKFEKPTPVQIATIPAIMENKDVMACAQTGTGKTGAFVLPILNHLITEESSGYGKGPRILIVTPTRELATQIFTCVKTFARDLNISSTVLMGGVPYPPQEKALKSELDIIVATPGRLIDHMNEGRVDFSRIETVVIDEADRMLDMGFLKSIEAVFGEIVTNIQTLLFSATFDDSVEKFAKRMLRDPIRADLAKNSDNHKNITQIIYKAKDLDHKQKMIEHILSSNEIAQVIIFVATKYSTEKLSRSLNKIGLNAKALHGDMKQAVRKKVMAKMHSGSLDILVATDVAARGIDVKKLSHVINFDLPRMPEDYIHRIGRTGRAKSEGIAISLVGPKDMPALNRIEAMLKKKMRIQILKV